MDAEKYDHGERQRRRSEKQRTPRGNLFFETFSSVGSATLTSVIFVSATIIGFVSSDWLPVILSMDGLSFLFGR